MRRALILWIAVALATPASAQAWFTKEVCTVEAPRIHPEIFGPSGYQEIQAAARKIPNHTGRLWRITSPEGAVSHLWGTLHSNDPLMLRLPPELEAAIAQARTVATEISFLFPDRRAVHAANSEWRWNYIADGMPNIDRLDLPDPLHGWIAARMDSLGWEADALAELRLSVVAGILLSDPCNDFNAWEFPTQDSRIATLAGIHGASLIGLEDRFDFRRRLERDQTLRLTEALIAVYGSYLQPPEDNTGRATSFRLYLEGRIGEMMAWERRYFDGLYPSGQGIAWLELTDDYLLTERNRTFVAASREDLNRGDMVIAVGAFHLPGETGLVALLRREGFTVDRVPLAGEAPG